MTATSAAPRRRAGGVRRRIGSFWAGISAVGTKELRGRMRGRRAFVVVTVYLLLLSVFAFAIYAYLKQRAAIGNTGFGTLPGSPGIDTGWLPTQSGAGTALSASIGHGIFGGLLGVETLLVLVLAPAFTSGAISLEREKQTIDMLVTTPLSTLGMVIGKLFSALIYVFLLILASIPLASVVFVFGGVGPEDLVRGYVMLFALAFGMGAIGLFISALVRRTQTAIVATFIAVLVLSIGTFGVHEFLKVATRPAPTGTIIVAQRPHQAPEAVLWLNPFVADLDLVCTTSTGSYHRACEYMSSVTGKPYFGSSPETPIFGGEVGRGGVFVDPDFGVIGDDVVIDCPPGVECAEPGLRAAAEPAQPLSLGFPRDTFWPKSAAAFAILGVVLTLLSAQLVAPTRRWRLPRPTLRRRVRGTASATDSPADPSPEATA